MALFSILEVGLFFCRLKEDIVSCQQSPQQFDWLWLVLSLALIAHPMKYFSQCLTQHRLDENTQAGSHSHRPTS